MKKKDVKGAKARGFLSAEDVKALRSRTGSRRVCVTCGRQFKTFDQQGTRMFGCGCCSWTYMRATLDRRIRKDDRVTLIWLGKAGQVVGFTKDGDDILAVVDTEIGNERYAVPSDQIERVHALEIEHAHKCRHGRLWKDRQTKNKEEDSDEDFD